ncbi:unnamed protein product [Blepharisma stoltei]|uniref:Uncharacterized protein n=1 Tax=Blepharisma stoltei TaxID=1481888 RepID=A0AAU9IJ58_9CILI|nr:unnamed protein product [Blepharisma stoltei]
MHRAIPVSNKILSKKWDEHTNKVHHDKLKNIRSQVDSSCPVTFGQLKRKPKKEQLVEDRYTEIERENRILLEKMSQIMQGKGSRSESRNKKSLNQEKRRRDLVQITIENHAMLKRLQDKQPSYNVHRWEEERKQVEKRLLNICEYPYRLGATEDLRGIRKFSQDGRGSNISTGSRPVISANSRKGPRKLSPLNKKNQKTVVYKKGINIGPRYFLVEMQVGRGSIWIFAHDVENPETFSLELPYNEALELMDGKENWNILAASLSLEQGELVLIDTRDIEVHSGSQYLFRELSGQKSLHELGNTAQVKPSRTEEELPKEQSSRSSNPFDNSKSRSSRSIIKDSLTEESKSNKKISKAGQEFDGYNSYSSEEQNFKDENQFRTEKSENQEKSSKTGSKIKFSRKNSSSDEGSPEVEDKEINTSRGPYISAGERSIIRENSKGRRFNSEMRYDPGWDPTFDESKDMLNSHIQQESLTSREEENSSIQKSYNEGNESEEESEGEEENGSEVEESGEIMDENEQEESGFVEENKFKESSRISESAKSLKSKTEKNAYYDEIDKSPDKGSDVSEENEAELSKKLDELKSYSSNRSSNYLNKQSDTPFKENSEQEEIAIEQRSIQNKSSSSIHSPQVNKESILKDQEQPSYEKQTPKDQSVAELGPTQPEHYYESELSSIPQPSNETGFMEEEKSNQQVISAEGYMGENENSNEEDSNVSNSSQHEIQVKEPTNFSMNHEIMSESSKETNQKSPDQNLIPFNEHDVIQHKSHFEDISSIQHEMNHESSSNQIISGEIYVNEAEKVPENHHSQIMDSQNEINFESLKVNELQMENEAAEELKENELQVENEAAEVLKENELQVENEESFKENELEIENEAQQFLKESEHQDSLKTENEHHESLQVENEEIAEPSIEHQENSLKEPEELAGHQENLQIENEESAELSMEHQKNSQIEKEELAELSMVHQENLQIENGELAESSMKGQESFQMENERLAEPSMEHQENLQIENEVEFEPLQEKPNQESFQMENEVYEESSKQINHFYSPKLEKPEEQHSQNGKMTQQELEPSLQNISQNEANLINLLGEPKPHQELNSSLLNESFERSEATPILKNPETNESDFEINAEVNMIAEHKKKSGYVDSVLPPEHPSHLLSANTILGSPINREVGISTQLMMASDYENLENIAEEPENLLVGQSLHPENFEISNEAIADKSHEEDKLT